MSTRDSRKGARLKSKHNVQSRIIANVQTQREKTEAMTHPNHTLELLVPVTGKKDDVQS